MRRVEHVILDTIKRESIELLFTADAIIGFFQAGHLFDVPLGSVRIYTMMKKG